MELPRLRLRRVFEHGPAFKVQRPGQPALTIAKKALSPNLQAKLRKYAEGGSVEEATDGIDLERDKAISETLARQAAELSAENRRVSDVLARQQQKFAAENEEREKAISATLARQEIGFAAENQQITDALTRQQQRLAVENEDVANAALDEYRKSLMTGEDLARLRSAAAALPDEQKQRLFGLAMTARRDKAQASQQRITDALTRQRDRFAVENEDVANAALDEYRKSLMTGEDLARLRSAAAALPDEQKQRLFGLAMTARRVAQSEDALSAALNKFRSSAMSEADAREFREALKSSPLDESAKDRAFGLAQIALRQTRELPVSDVLASRYYSAAPVQQASEIEEYGYSPDPILGREIRAEARAPAEMMGPREMVGPPVPTEAMLPTVAMPARPAKVAAPGINIPDTIKGTTIADFEAAIKANPQADPAAVATALVTAKAPQITPPNFDQITAAPPSVDSKTAVDKFDAAVAAKAAALTEEAKADFDTKQEMVRIAQASEARQLAAAKKDADTATKLAQRKESLEKAIGQGFQPQSMWGRMSAPQKVGSLISLAVGGFLSGYTDTKNYVYEAFNNLLENDLDVQKGNYNSLLKQYERLLGDEAAARKLAEADLLNLTALQVKSVEARSNLRGIGPQLAAVRADLDMKAAANREEVRKKMFDADIAQINADTQRGLREAEEKAKLAKAAPRAGIGATRGSVSAERLEFAKAQYKEGKRFTVPDPEDPAKSIVIEAISKPAAQKSIQTITQRVDGTMRLEEFLKFLALNKDKPTTPETIRGMQIRLKGVVENYPGTARGSYALVTTAQAKMITPAVEDFGLPIVKYLDSLGMTSTAIKELRSDAVRGVKLAVQGAADPADPGFKEFSGKWSEQGYQGRTGISAKPGASTPAAPAKIGEGEEAKPQYMKMRAPQGFKNKAGKDLSGQVLGIPMNQVAAARSAGFVEVP